MKERILIFVDWYEPGFRGGGPIRSCVNLTQHLKDSFEVFVFTRDRDLGMAEPYKNVLADKWITINDIKIFYGSPSKLTWRNIVFQIVHEVRPHFVYVNGMFSRIFSVYPVLINKFYDLKAKFIIVPRGMLKSTALQFKKSRKMFFLKVLRFLNVYREIIFQATDETERTDIRKIFGVKSKINLIPNFAPIPKDWVKPPLKTADCLKIIFVGRTHPIKNLHRILEWLPHIGGEILFTVITTDENPEYWDQCQQMIDKLPASVKTIVRKDVPHAEVEKFYADHHIFVQPTEGENFGHAIFEALSFGKPVIISDQTPWRGLLTKKAGWDIPLNAPQNFIDAIRIASSWNEKEINNWSYNAWSMATAYAKDENIKKLYLELFSNT